MARAGLDERRLRPASPLRTPLDDSPDEKGSLSLTSQDWRLRGLGRRGVGDERACDGAGVAPGMIRGGGRVQICYKGAPGRDRPRRKARNINDSSCAPRLDWGLCGRFGHGPGSDRVRLVPRDPRAPSVSGSASRRPSRGRTWRPGRIVPGRTRLRGRQNRAIMRKPTDTPGAGARTILPGRQNRVRAPGPARPRPRRGAPVQQIRTHPAPQAPYAPLRHTQNNLPGSLWQIWTTGAAAGPVVRASPASARSTTSTPARTPARRAVADRASTPFDRAGPARAPPRAPRRRPNPRDRHLTHENVPLADDLAGYPTISAVK